MEHAAAISLQSVWRANKIKKQFQWVIPISVPFRWTTPVSASSSSLSLTLVLLTHPFVDAANES